MKNIRILICTALVMLGFVNTLSAQVKIIRTVAGTGVAGSTGDGAGATAARVDNPYGYAYDGAGNLYIAEQGGDRIRRINTNTGIITTVAGTGTAGSTGDGGPATNARLNGPTGVAVDAAGDLYIADAANNRIRKVTMSTGIISLVAGVTTTAGFSGDGGPATLAALNNPRGIAVDAAGNIYFSDPGPAFGSTYAHIRVINGTTGIINSIAGAMSVGLSGDGGPAIGATFRNPRGVAVDAAGNVFVADMGNHRIRRIDGTTGLISTYAGTSMGYSGDGAAAIAAQLNAPSGVNLDPAGNIIVADAGNQRVRMVNGGGIISHMIGTGSTVTGGFAGDWGPATAARINGAVGVVYDPAGSYYLYDRNNQRIRLIKNNSVPYFVGGSHQTMTVCENSAPNSINAEIAIIDSDRLQTETWTVYTAPLSGTLVSLFSGAANGGTVTPTGRTYQPNPGFSGTDSFIVQISDGYNTSLDTIVVTVNPLPVVPAITGLTEVCEAATITLANTTPGGVWTGTNGNTSVAAATGDVTGVAAGTDLISYSVTNACGTTMAFYTVTINPLPNPGFLSGASFVCTGGTTVISESVPGGVWSASNANATVLAGVVTGVTAGTVDISYTVTNACGNSSAIHSLNVLDPPTVGVTTGPAVVCEASAILLSNPTFGGAWSASNANATVSPGGLVTGVTAGAVSISYTITNSCGSATDAYPVTVNPLPVAGTISGPGNVCVANTVTLTNPASGGVWSASNANATVSPTGDVTGVSAGAVDITYTVTNSCGVAATTFPMNVFMTPSAGTITGPSSVCEGSFINLSDAISGGIWTASNTNATVSPLGVVAGISAGTVDITYTVTLPCGTDFTVRNITVNPLALAGTITGPTTVCIGSSISLTDAAAGGVWSASNSNATVSPLGIVNGVSAGLVTISYSVTNVCGAAVATSAISVNPLVAPSVSFTASPGFTTCPGILVTYNAFPVNGGGAPLYEWSVNGTVMGSTSSFVYAPATGDVVACMLTSSASCITAPTATDTHIATVNPSLIPSVSISTGILGDTVCIGTLVSYNATPVNGGSLPGYQWKVNGITMAGGNPFTYSPAHGDVVTCDMTSSYSCATPAVVTSNAKTMTVDVTQTPAVSIWSNPGSPVCVGTNVRFTANPLYGGTAPSFRWTKNGVNVATGPTYNYIPGNGDNVYCLLASSSPCRTIDSVLSNVMIMSVQNPVTPVVVISASPATSVGIGESVTLTAIATGAVAPTYQWYVNSMPVAGAVSASFVLAEGTVAVDHVSCSVGSGDACNTTGNSNVLTIRVGNVGVKDVAAAGNELTLVPNPNKGAFTLNGLVAAGNTEANVVITNVIGQVVYQETIAVQNGVVKHDISLGNNLANGVYMLNVTSGEERKVARFSLEK